MSKLTNIPVIDIFAGPGGLGEGFSSTNKNRKNIFDIKLSIEKDKYAHETLELRSFFRKFKKGEVPSEYYEILQEPDLKTKRTLKQKLFRIFPEEYNTAQKEATRFTEVGYVGRDVEQIIRDLIEIAIAMEKEKKKKRSSGKSPIVC